MKISAKQFAIALYDSLQEVSPADQEKVLDNFVQVLKETGAINIFPKIEQEFIVYQKKQRGITDVNVTFARRDVDEKVVLDELNKLISGNKEVKKQVDEGLVGGVMIETEDQRVDASVKRLLGRFRESLAGRDDDRAT